MNDGELRSLLARRAEGLDTTEPDRLPALHTRIRAARRRRTAGAVGAGLVAVAAATCGVVVSGQADDGPTTVAAPPAEQRTLRADGASADTVLAELEVPAGYGEATWFVGSDEVTVAYWVVAEVPTDPCLETGRRDPGPTVADLVRALDDQELTTVTREEPVELDGYDGTYLEITAPDLDLTTCRDGELWYWETPLDGARHHPWPAGAVERVWVVDVDGQRVVLSGLVEPDAPEDAVAELEGVVDSVRFVDPRRG